MARERIGILGGTFDPIHAGHLSMAKAAKKQAKLDQVLVMPTGNPPHKRGISAPEDRWRMVCMALAQEDGLKPSRIELDRKGTIYTVDTLRILQESFKKADLFFIIGADTLLELQHWREYEKVLKMCTFLVCPRQWDAQPEKLIAEQQRLEALGGRFQAIEMEKVVTSSTAIRQALSTGAATPELLVCCREYAQLKGLYGLAPRYEQAARWLDLLAEDLNDRRLAHSLGVGNTARHLAIVHGLDVGNAEIAGILHDCAKCKSLREMQQMKEAEGLELDAEMCTSVSLMHGPVGALMAGKRYGVAEKAVLEAIACHTTGRPGMTLTDLAVYIADKIEPGRRDYPGVERVRTLAQLNLYQAALASMEGTSEYVQKSGKKLHPATTETIRWLRSVLGMTPPEQKGLKAAKPRKTADKQ